MSLEPDIILSDVVSAGSTGGLLSIYANIKFIISTVVQESVLIYMFPSWLPWKSWQLNGMPFCIKGGDSTSFCTAKTFQVSGKKHINVTSTCSHFQNMYLIQLDLSGALKIVFYFMYVIHICCRCSHDRSGWRIDGRTYFSRK